MGLLVRILLLIAAAGCPAAAARAEHMGGTVSDIVPGDSGSLDVADQQYLVFFSGKKQWRVDYQQIRVIEYGQKVDRRLLLGALISPMFLLSKSRRHFLTLGFHDERGRDQAIVFRVSKDDIRALLVSLETRTGRRVEFQDEEARKAGKG
ncbi:MAG: hypothetical protein K2X35_24820 [Bryobacteraceae bacterium]|nr:hypothetical protein [Bryobacteraceae bacterium]